MAKHSPHILELAKRGAEVRLRELTDEIRMLTLSFPHLRDSFDKDELRVSFILKKGARAAKRQAGGHRRKMSAAARKAISKRMKKSWAKRRKAAAKQAGAKT
jgi:hypothetical protein